MEAAESLTSNPEENEGATAKRLKLEKSVSALSPPTCGHWVQRKKRYCKMTVAKGRQFCGEHEPIGEEVLTEVSRIPCPLDETHTIYSKNLQKHLKICNARRKENLPAFIVQGINAGNEDITKEDYSCLKLNELNDTEFYGVIEKVKELYTKFLDGKIETLQEQHKSLNDELATDINGKEAKRHIVQAAALLGVLEKEQQLDDLTSFIEFGAGKGQLAFYLAKILQQQRRKNSQVILVDRMSHRHKKDNKIEDRSLVQRIRADIADFHMSGLETLKQTKRIVALSKHLCGAATDLTLRCVTQGDPSTEFILIALCCHHRCTWREFVGKEFLQRHDITPRQFVIITKMVSWAICGTGMSRERRRAIEEQALAPEEVYEENSKQRLPLGERQNIGVMCKRVLDFARLEYLRQHGYEAALKFYVPLDVTLENVCLLARRIKE